LADPHFTNLHQQFMYIGLFKAIELVPMDDQVNSSAILADILFVIFNLPVSGDLF
jgi:hypothetical protein